MQKTLLILCLLFAVSIGSAQNLPVDSKSGKITFMKTVEATGLSAQQIYDIIKKWGQENSLTVKEDKAGAKIVYDASFEVEYPATKSAEKIKGTINYKFQLGAKDGKYRYILIDFVHKGQPEDGGSLENREPDCKFTNISSRSWTVIKQSTHKQALAIVESLKKKITAEQNDPTKSDDW